MGSYPRGHTLTMHDIFSCSYCIKEFEKAFAAQPKSVRLSTLNVFITAVAEGIDDKTEAEIAASPNLTRDADWLKRARAALAEAERTEGADHA